MEINAPINYVKNTNGQKQSATVGSSSASVNGTITYNKNTKGGEESATLSATLQLPSYVDDVIEVETYNDLPATGETGKIYVVKDTNLTYRWSGSTYIQIGSANGVYWCTYGTTTYSEITSAIDAGKLPCCKYNNKVYQYINSASTYYYFSMIENSTTTRLSCSNTNAWATSTTTALRNNMYGKNIRNFGDSIAYGAGYTGGYAKIIAGVYTGSTVTNSAVNGASLAPITGRDNIRTRVLNDTLNGAAYILIDGGINDAWEETFTNYGTVSNSWTTFDTNTTAGALEDIFRYIYATKPSAVTVYVFPHDGMLPETSDWHTKVKPLILKILNKWNIPYVDIAASTPKMGTYGIPGLSTTYTTDGTHPNQDCYTRFYRDAIAMKMLYPFNETIPSDDEDDSSTVKEILLTNTQLTTTGVKFERTTSQLNVNNGEYLEAIIDLSTCDNTDQELISLGCDIANWAGLNFHLYKIGTSMLRFQSCHTAAASWTELDDVLLSNIPDTSNIVVKIAKGNMYINDTKLTNASKTTSGVAYAIWSQIATDGHMEIGCCQSPKTVTIKSLKIMRTSTFENVSNKATNFNVIDDVKYPTTKAVRNYINASGPVRVIDTTATYEDVEGIVTGGSIPILMVNGAGDSCRCYTFSSCNDTTTDSFEFTSLAATDSEAAIVKYILSETGWDESIVNLQLA